MTYFLKNLLIDLMTCLKDYISVVVNCSLNCNLKIEIHSALFVYFFVSLNFKFHPNNFDIFVAAVVLFVVIVLYILFSPYYFHHHLLKTT